MVRLVCLLLVATPLVAQDLVTDRPDQTESAIVVPPGRFQLEAGVLTERGVPTAGAALLRIGLDARVEARVGFAGRDDLTVGAKVMLTRPGAATTTALLGTARLTSAAAGFGLERLDPEFRIALATPLTDRLSLGVNAGALWTTVGAISRTDALYTAVLGIGVSERLGLFVESYGTLPVSSGGAAEHLLDGGMTVLLSPSLQLDAAAGIGVNDAAAAWFAGVGLSVRVPR